MPFTFTYMSVFLNHMSVCCVYNALSDHKMALNPLFLEFQTVMWVPGIVHMSSGGEADALTAQPSPQCL